MPALNKILPGHKYVANFVDAPVRLWHDLPHG